MEMSDVVLVLGVVVMGYFALNELYSVWRNW